MSFCYTYLANVLLYNTSAMDATIHPFLMDEALAWEGGHQVVPNLHWVFRHLTTTPSSWRVSSDWPGHCPSPLDFQLVSSLLCQSQLEAFSDASSRPRTAAFLK